uniref:Uncharacterized protein n=1 Tax=Ixodes ricinus TaxID=34613 RepID=A0A0K8RCQ9_IXORI
MGTLSRDPDLPGIPTLRSFPVLRTAQELWTLTLDTLVVFPSSKSPLSETRTLTLTTAPKCLASKKSSQWLKVKALTWVIPVVYTHFWLAAVTSLLAPYFPPLASSRGVPAWKYGFGFSAFKLSMLPGHST